MKIKEILNKGKNSFLEGVTQGNERASLWIEERKEKSLKRKEEKQKKKEMKNKNKEK